MAQRLQRVLDHLVALHQLGGIKRRSTFSSIQSTLDIKNQENETKSQGAFIFVDFAKAFDSVDWSFIYKVLETMNYGKYYIHCVKTLYHNCKTAVTNNGHLRTFFSPSRAIRQGYSISATLFVLLANTFRKNLRISRVKF